MSKDRALQVSFAWEVILSHHELSLYRLCYKMYRGLAKMQKVRNYFITHSTHVSEQYYGPQIKRGIKFVL